MVNIKHLIYTTDFYDIIPDDDQEKLIETALEVAKKYLEKSNFNFKRKIKIVSKYNHIYHGILQVIIKENKNVLDDAFGYEIVDKMLIMKYNKNYDVDVSKVTVLNISRYGEVFDLDTVENFKD